MPGTASECNTFHTVVPGDRCPAIASDYGISLDNVRSALYVDPSRFPADISLVLFVEPRRRMRLPHSQDGILCLHWCFR
jgi:hypothetical protein